MSSLNHPGMKPHESLPAAHFKLHIFNISSLKCIIEVPCGLEIIELQLE